MKKNNLKTNHGFTLVEMIVAISLLSLVLLIVSSLILTSNKMMAISEKEYDYQSAVRAASQSTSVSIRYSTAVFTVPQSRFNPDNLDEDWDYIGIVDTDDGQEIVKYVYNSDTHVHDATVLVPAQADVAYQFAFNKNNPSDEDNLLEFTIKTIPEGSVDEYGRAKATLTITSEVSALNSLQVIDFSTEYDPAGAIAFKPDDRTRTVVGHVAMVLDTSGSMAEDMEGHEYYVYEVNRRITILKNKATALINTFAQESNIDVALIPFATSANTTSYHTHEFLNAKTETADLLDEIDDLDANGGTNTGDGLRRAYYALVDHNAEAGASGYTPSNYLIVLVDGETTYYSVKNIWPYNSFMTDDGNINTSNQVRGSGSHYDSTGGAYVIQMGALFKNTSFAKVYVIGFSAEPADLVHISELCDACSTDTEYYQADSAEALEDVFSEIEGAIVEDLWYLQGPDL